METKDKELEEQAESIMKSYKAFYQAPIDLPEEFLRDCAFNPVGIKEGKSGAFEIVSDTKKAGEPLTVVSARNWLMTGYAQKNIVLDIDRKIYQLKLKGHGLLMSDSPQEMFLQYKNVENAKGRVLVGGLGLGMYANMIAKKTDVTEVVVVEIEEDIIKLSKPHHLKIKVVHQDIWKYIEETKEKFDYAYIDIHYSTGATEYINTVLPMRKIFEKRMPDVPVEFWAEEEMKSQYTDNEKQDEDEKNGNI